MRINCECPPLLMNYCLYLRYGWNPDHPTLVLEHILQLRLCRGEWAPIEHMYGDLHGVHRLLQTDRLLILVEPGGGWVDSISFAQTQPSLLIRTNANPIYLQIFTLSGFYEASVHETVLTA